MKITNKKFLIMFSICILSQTFACTARFIALNDPDWKNRQQAVLKLRPPSTPIDNKLLTQIALHDDHEKVRYAATKKINDQKILTQIALNDKSPKVRKIAVFHLTDQKILTQIALKDKNKSVRWRAVKKIANRKALEQIILRDNSSSVRKAAVESLGKIKDPLSIDHLVTVLENDFAYIKNAAIDSLGKIGPPAVLPLINFLKNEKSKRHKLKIIDVLGKIRDPRASEFLIRILDYDIDDIYRGKVLLALKKINDKREMEIREKNKLDTFNSFKKLIKSDPNNIDAKWAIAKLSEHYIKAIYIQCYKTFPNHKMARITVDTSESTFCHVVSPNSFELYIDSCSLKIPNPVNQSETITINNSDIIDGSGFIYLKYNTINKKIEKTADGKLLVENKKDDFWIVDIHDIPFALY